MTSFPYAVTIDSSFFNGANAKHFMDLNCRDTYEAVGVVGDKILVKAGVRFYEIYSRFLIIQPHPFKFAPRPERVPVEKRH